MKRMSKKVSLLLLTISCGCLGTGLVDEPLPGGIDSKLEPASGLERQIENSGENTVTFEGEGAINVSPESGDATAVKVSFADGLTDEEKKDLPLVLDFRNEPSVEVAVNELGDDLNPTGAKTTVGSAHVYAHAKNGDAVALHVADGVNVEFTGDTENLYKLAEKPEDQKRVGIFAYSESVDQNHIAVGIVLDGKAEGETPSTPDTGYDQTLTFLVPTKIYAKSEVSGGYNYSAAAAIGKARANCLRMITFY